MADRRCYNCQEYGHAAKACQKAPTRNKRGREEDPRWQSRGVEPTIEEELEEQHGYDELQAVVKPNDSASNVGGSSQKECALKPSELARFEKKIDALNALVDRLPLVIPGAGRSEAGSADDRPTTVGSARAASPTMGSTAGSESSQATGMSRKEKKLGGLARKINRKVGAKAFRSPQEHNLREATAAMLGGPEPEDLDECLEVARMFCYVETGRCLAKGMFSESVEASACVEEYKSEAGEDMVRVKASLAMEIVLELPKDEYSALGATGLQKFARERLGAFTRKTQLGGVNSAMGDAIERAVRSERRGLLTVTAPCGKPERCPVRTR